MKNFNNKTVVITGAGSGIGRALALRFAAQGAQLALNDFNAENLAATARMAEEKNCKVYTQAFDVSNREDMHDFAQKVAKHYGHIDVVINNAGVSLARVTIKDVSYEDLEWVMGINFWGMVYGTKAFLPYLIQQKEASIVNISSLFGIMAVPQQGAYCTSKFAIRGFTETLRMEMVLDQPHVVASSVHPGGIKTNIARNSKPANGIDNPNHKKEAARFEKEFFITTPEDAAKTIMNGIQKKKGRILIGRDTILPSFLTRLFPSKYVNIIAKGMKKKGLLPK